MQKEKKGHNNRRALFFLMAQYYSENLLLCSVLCICAAINRLAQPVAKVVVAHALTGHSHSLGQSYMKAESPHTRGPSPIDFDGLSFPSTSKILSFFCYIIFHAASIGELSLVKVAYMMVFLLHPFSLLGIGARERREDTEVSRAARIQKISGAVRTILECIGEDPNREGLLKTPERYAKALMFFSKGYEESVTRKKNPTPIYGQNSLFVFHFSTLIGRWESSP